MAGYNQNQQDFYSGGNYGWETGGDGYAPYAGPGPGEPDFGTQQQFETFDYSGQQTSPPGPGPSSGSYFPEQQYTQYTGSIMTPTASPMPAENYSSDPYDFENEMPLMEELGINFDHITQKTLAVLNPLRQTDATILQETDLAGPLVFCLAFGGLLLLSGKVHFGYIYGIGVMGCIGLYMLLNLMSLTSVSLGCIISVLGYCLLPMVMLSGISIVWSLQGYSGSILAGLAVLWCTISSSRLFVTAFAMDHQQPLIAYPCALLYGVFALLTIF